MALPKVAAGASLFPWLDRRSDTVDKWLFLIAFFFGSITIMVLKALEAPQWLVTCAPLSIMAAYLIYILRTRKFLMRDENSGDALYYLGFLYTLVSLSMSLYQFNVSTGSGIEIVQNFGVALGTTIFGLTGRVLLAQLRRSPLETETLVRDELSHSARKLRDELDRILVDMSLFRDKVKLSLDEMKTTLNENVGGLANETVQNLTKTSAAFAGSSDTILKKIDTSFSQYSENSTRLNQAAGKIVKATEKLWERIDRIETPENLFNVKIDTMVEPIRAAAQAHAEQVQLIVRRSEALARTLADSSEAIQGAVKAFASSEQSIAGFTGDLAKLRIGINEVASVTDAMPRMRASLASVSECPSGDFGGRLSRLDERGT
jgi:uncharacterized protein YukE